MMNSNLIYKNDYFGFVYLWYDRKRKMYYIGSHMGAVDDGYVCSSKRMREAYRRGPEDFKRRILYWHSDENRKSLIMVEQLWLDQIKDHELSNRYYNQRKWCVVPPDSRATHWNKPEARVQHIESMKKAWTPERRAAHADKIRKKWNDPDYVAKMAARPKRKPPSEAELERLIEFNKSKDKWDTEARLKASLSAKERCSDPSYLEEFKNREIHKKRPGESPGL